MTVVTQPAEVEEDCEHALLEYFRALGLPTVYEFRAASLHEICAHVGREERETTLERLTAYLLDVLPLPPESEHKNQQRRVARMTTLSRRKQRRVDYERAKIFGEATRGDITINLWKAPGLPRASPKKLYFPSGKP